MSLRIASHAAFTILALGAALQADTIYSNFGTGDAYAAGAGVIVTNDGSALASVAIGFTPSADYNLASIEFVASAIIPDDLGLSIGIFADNGGQPGGAPLELFNWDGPLAQFGDAAPVMTVYSVLQPLLQANTPYWVGLNAPVGGLVVWNQNITSSLGFSQSDGSGNWSTSNADQGVVEIDGSLATAVDAPAPIVYSAPPVQGLALAPSQSQESVDSTPEPGAWWLMTGALAAIAARSRNRR